MAKFIYSMQNILSIKEKMETQERAAYAEANGKFLEEQNKLTELFKRQEDYKRKLRELYTGSLDVMSIKNGTRNVEAMDELIKLQMIEVHSAQRNLDVARDRLNEVIKDRKTHENLKEKQFEVFKQELNAEEMKAIDELTSYTHGEN